ncbi:MAG: SLC45 family MFS transporter [Flavobacteriales bacterium]|nr:SLC45 family MFS transporter [Flavobacteriales bacterium]
MQNTKPKLSFWQIWNMSFGFLGIQMGFALQNGNASRILTDFGANVESLSWFWLVAPLTGMIVQPIIGYWSDRTWSKTLGRRRPYFLAGAILACTALVLLPNADKFTGVFPALLVGAGFLMMMDTSFNISMEPFRALVADNLPESQSTRGFSIQTALIGVGAVVGSFLPWILANWFGVPNNLTNVKVQPNVVYSFYIGAVVFMAAILWTIFKTKEYSPQERIEMGIVEAEKPKEKFKIPTTMWKLGLIQFFSWFGLFCMWVYTTTALREHTYDLPSIDSLKETLSQNPHDKIALGQLALSENLGDWVGILFGIYNGVSAIFALLIPMIATKIGKSRTHMVSLVLGGFGLILMYFMPDKNAMILPMIFIGVAWASILAMPYSMLSGVIPADKMGVFMGIFNFFITLPQIVSALFSGPIVKHLFGGNAAYALMLGGGLMILAGILNFTIKNEN